MISNPNKEIIIKDIMHINVFARYCVTVGSLICFKIASVSRNAALKLAND